MAHATKQLLADSLKKMLNKKTLDKITVTELAEDCGVNRQTFYYNFQDIYDLLNWTYDEERRQLFDKNELGTDWFKTLTTIRDYLKTNKKFVLNTYHSLAHPILEKTIKNDLSPLITATIQEYAVNSNISEEDQAFMIKVYTLALAGIIREWLDNDMDDDYELDLEKLQPLIHRNLQSNIEQLCK